MLVLVIIVYILHTMARLLDDRVLVQGTCQCVMCVCACTRTGYLSVCNVCVCMYSYRVLVSV